MNDFSRASTLTLRRNSSAAPSSRPKNVGPSTDVDRTKTGKANDDGERILRSESLLQGRSHIGITHNGETYQLRATRLGKLILTK
ncbi:hemin uptake protein HemP [Trinickia violacea]|uniref:Hemin uptake protein HemP n=1 Tax=Trinickia violacea TaxID=2571746 RepID=A0A4P8IJ95_9BURK|nr:hemin uptake protein HemP [Trinickia violacea]QCP48828.1 hemin uptake protein HemP [Trinickia violacea]